MPDPVITNIDLGNVIYKDACQEDGLLTFGGAIVTGKQETQLIALRLLL